MGTYEVLGAMGQPLPEDAGTLVSDADGCLAIEQVRWLRQAMMVTPTGRLIRQVDTNHVLDLTGMTCRVCGGSWPCASWRLEVAAERSRRRA